jgi:hypothetical protein
MHRVYNSAFMHMLPRRERRGLPEADARHARVRPRDPQALRQLHEQPDEKTARRSVRQGRQVFRGRDRDGDDARACRCSVTARSRVSARSTAWSSGARRSTSTPDPWLLERHQREIFPLLHRRAWFAEVHDFLLFDFHTDGGGVDEHVLAYSNGNGPTRSLVVFHDRFASTAGTIRESAAYARKSAAAPSGSSGVRSPRASGCRTTRRCS